MIDDRMRTPANGGATVWVYDERRRVRDDVAARLVALPFVGRVEVIGDGASLMSRLTTRRPDVLLVGTQRAVDTGLASATQALRAHPGLAVLVLGAPDDAETVRAAVAFGARGYLRWDASHAEVCAALAHALAGVELGGQRGNGQSEADIRLTARELQVLVGMTEGKSNGEIGRELFLSEDTVKTHARRLFRKLGVNDRAQAVALGFRRGLVT